MERIIPDRWISMRDSFGHHKVRVYEDTKALEMVLEKRIHAQSKDQDSIYLVSGIEGVGKSNLCLWAADIYGRLKGEPVPLDNVTRNIEELQARIAELERKNFLTCDEGSEFDATRWNEKQSKELKEYFTIMRKAGFIIFLTFPNPLKVSTYLREDRVRGCFFIKKHGICYYYANSPENPHFATILERWNKDNQTRSIRFFTKYAPDFIMYFKEYKGDLRKAYEHRKDENISKVFSKYKKEVIAPGEELLTLAEASKLYKFKSITLGNMCRSGKLPFTMIGTKKMLRKADMEAYITKISDMMRFRKVREKRTPIPSEKILLRVGSNE